MGLINRIYTNTHTAIQWMIIEIHGDIATLWNCHSYNSQTMELPIDKLNQRFIGWIIT